MTWCGWATPTARISSRRGGVNTRGGRPTRGSCWKSTWGGPSRRGACLLGRGWFRRRGRAAPSRPAAWGGRVLAGPGTALVAQSSGGYAVEVVGPGNTRRYVPVTVGIFDDTGGLVQVTGALTPGQRVVVAAS